MTSNELLSVVVPVYNCERFLAEALQSIQSQRFPRIETIVVDDGSTDASGAIAESFAGVRLLRQSNQGISAARNAGIALARGSLLAFLDADDLWTAGKLALQIDALHAEKERNFVSGGVEQFFDRTFDPKSAAPPPKFNTACAGALLIRTSDFHRVGLFNPTLRLGEFIDWYSRAMSIGFIEHCIESTVLRRRIHGSNTTIRSRASSSDYLSVIKAHLHRKRAAT